ncbi:hypothetical protein D3C80_597420 [compost metagenome]
MPVKKAATTTVRATPRAVHRVMTTGLAAWDGSRTPGAGAMVAALMAMKCSQHTPPAVRAEQADRRFQRLMFGSRAAAANRASPPATARITRGAFQVRTAPERRMASMPVKCMAATPAAMVTVAASPERRRQPASAPAKCRCMATQKAAVMIISDRKVCKGS